MADKVGDIMQSDSLSMLVRMQKDLMEVIKERTGKVTNMSEVTLAMMVEVAEWANVHGSFKVWKLNHSVDRDVLLEEFVDILFFWLQALILQNFTVLDVIRAYTKKYDVNIQRQKTGY